VHACSVTFGPWFHVLCRGILYRINRVVFSCAFTGLQNRPNHVKRLSKFVSLSHHHTALSRRWSQKLEAKGNLQSQHRRVKRCRTCGSGSWLHLWNHYVSHCRRLACPALHDKGRQGKEGSTLIVLLLSWNNSLLTCRNKGTLSIVSMTRRLLMKLRFVCCHR
jgi:hypothetical protein